MIIPITNNRSGGIINQLKIPLPPNAYRPAGDAHIAHKINNFGLVNTTEYRAIAIGRKYIIVIPIKVSDASGSLLYGS